MKALIVERDGSLAIQEVSKPVPGPKQALVKTIACGICGTDTKIIHRCFKGFPDSAYPLILGHEGVGEVIELGAEVTTYKVGDKVLLPFLDATPEMGSAYGALSEYTIVHDAAAYPPNTAPEAAYAQTVLPTDINPIDAVMFVTFREVLSAIRYFSIQPQDSVVVYGCGPVGQVFVKFLNLLGSKDIVAVDIVDEKLSFARQNGALLALNAYNTDVGASVRVLYPEGVRHVIDAAGSLMVVNMAMEILADRGNVLNYGVLPSERITIDFSPAPYNWNFICQQMPRKQEEAAAHEQVLEWLREGRLLLKDFISDYFQFSDAAEAYVKYLDGNVLKKGIIKF